MSFYNDALQQNNTEIQSNNTDLQGLLDTINALPVAENLDTVLAQQETLITDIKTALEGKAGLSVETCTVTFEGSGIFDSLCYTTLEDGEYTFVSSNVGSGGGSVTVLKDSILFVYAQHYGMITQLQGGVSSLCTTYNYDIGGNIIGIYSAAEGYYYGILHITGDCTIEYTNPEYGV